MPVVEAMRRLESEGVLLKQARKQAIVRKLSEKDLEGLYLLREAIESVAARLAALRATPEETRVLEKLAEAFEGNVEANHDSGDADLAIHRHIAASARCPLLNEELDRLLLIERTAGRSFDSETEQICHPHCHRILNIEYRQHFRIKNTDSISELVVQLTERQGFNVESARIETIASL